MNYQLQDIFPDVDASTALALVDGVIAMSDADIRAAVQTDAFMALPPGRRAMLVALWTNHQERGSNQHATRISNATPRAAAECVERLIARFAA